MKRSVLRSRMRGLSLVEVLVSLVIGLAVVGAVLVSYISSGKTGQQQAAYAEMNENAQMGLTLLSRDLLLAGYAQPTGLVTAGTPPVTTFGRTYSARPVFGCDNGFVSPSTTGAVACAATAGTPAIEVVYEADLVNTVPTSANIPSDCLGNTLRPVAGTLVGVDYFHTYNRYYLSVGNTGRSELHCASRTQDTSGQPVPGQPLVDNVEDMKIWYGEAGSAGSRQIVRYVTAPTGNTIDWQNIISVRVCLLMRSSEPALDSELVAAPKYLDCDSVEQDLPDRHLRRAYFMTTTLRNKMAF